MSDNHSRFNFKGVYRCVECGDMTRETGLGESSVQMCKYCYQIGELENQLLDGDIGEAEYTYRYQQIMKSKHQ